MNARPVRPPAAHTRTCGTRPPRRWPTASPPRRLPKRPSAAAATAGARSTRRASTGSSSRNSTASTRASASGPGVPPTAGSRSPRSVPVPPRRRRACAPATGSGPSTSKPVTGHPVTEVVSLLRGEHAGTAVRLGLSRGTRVWTETLRRANLATESVTVSRLPGGTVLIKVAAFTKGSGDRVRSAVRDAPRATASSSTCAATRAAWSRRRSPRRRRSSTAGSWRRTTYEDASAPCTPSAAATPPDRWSRSSTAAR